jgi:NDP-sugar pyrophosphorylase family protein
MTRAVVLAGGLGMRLRPYTAVLPKPLMPIGDRPVLDVVVRQLRHHGFERITVATGYLAELIEAFFRDGAEYDVAIDYHREHTPLGTAGAIAGLEGLTEPFLVMNGDVITDLDYAHLMQTHVESGAVATIATITRDIQVSLGVLHFADPHQPDRLTSYEEKPHFEFEASMGVYAFSPKTLEYMAPDEHLDFPDLIRRLLDAGETVRAYRSECYWLDIGRHDDYEQALNEFERMRHKLIPGEPHGERRTNGDDRRTGDDRRADDADRRTGDDRRELPDRRTLPESNGHGSLTQPAREAVLRARRTEQA